MPININTQTYANITLIVKEALGTVFEQFMMTIERDFITSIVSFSGVELRKRFNFLFSAKLPRLKELSIRCTMHQRTSLGSTVYIRLIFLVFSVCKESYIICLILLCMSREVIFITNVICWRRRSFQSTTRNSNAPSYYTPRAAGSPRPGLPSLRPRLRPELLGRILRQIRTDFLRFNCTL